MMEERTKALHEIKDLTETATYNDLLVYRDWVNKQIEILQKAQQEKAWLAVRDAIKVYTRDHGRITVNSRDGECIAIEFNSDFGTFGEIDAPEW